MNTYDIFLIPTINQYKKYTEIINTLSNKYKTPSFPHVTILEMVGIEENELIAKVREITRYFNKIEVDIFGINFSNTIHQCVFAQIKMSQQLLTLYNKLETNLHFFEKSPFFPHMSLIYGELTPEEKSNVAKLIKFNKKLLLDKLVIYKDGPLASDWKYVTEFKLK